MQKANMPESNLVWVNFFACICNSILNFKWMQTILQMILDTRMQILWTQAWKMLSLTHKILNAGSTILHAISSF